MLPRHGKGQIMKTGKRLRKPVLALAISLLLTGTALASVIGELIDGYDVYLGAGAELSKGVYWTGSDYRTENYIEYSPSSEVYPVVVSGSKVCNYGNFSSMAALLENQGKHVIAGINGDYYVMSTNMPLGIVVENGRLRSSDAGHWAVGFRADGSAFIGKPALSISADTGGKTIYLNAFNKTRGTGEAVLFTDDFAANTKSSGESVDVVCSISGAPKVGSSFELTVEKKQDSAGSSNIPAGKAILSVSKNASQERLDFVSALQPGDKISINISGASGWESVSYAIGSLYKLVTNGQVENGLDATAAPRSAVGIKADGSVVFYTMDGRQNGHSVGVSMKQLAQRMIELGCVEATIMDGGGSTSMNAIYIGENSLSQINKPSEGYQRSVTNYVMLVTDSKATGVADRLALYPLNTNILSGASTAFVLKAADANGYSAALNTYVDLGVTDNLGTIAPDGSFTATGEGRGSITAEGTGLVPAAAGINVVRTPDTLRVFREGTSTAVTSLDVTSGSMTSLMAQAMDNYIYLISQDNCYTWAVTGDIGVIDEQGNFTASSKSADGAITVTAGDKTVTIPVKVTGNERYDDVTFGSWYYEDVNYVSDLNIMSGLGGRDFAPDMKMSRAMTATVLHRLEGSPATSVNSGFTDVTEGQWHAQAIYWASENKIVEGYGTYFSPDGSITREELAAMLYRYYGSPEVSGTLAAFADADKVSDWALNAMTWAVEKGVIEGISATELSPGGAATRAQVASILARLHRGS